MSTAETLTCRFFNLCYSRTQYSYNITIYQYICLILTF